MLSLLYRIRCFVHIQSDHALDLGNICRMNFEAVLLLHIFLNTLIGRMLLDLAGFTSILTSTVSGFVSRDKRTTVSTCLGTIA